jgi:hypothetical protein
MQNKRKGLKNRGGGVLIRTLVSDPSRGGDTDTLQDMGHLLRGFYILYILYFTLYIIIIIIIITFISNPYVHCKLKVSLTSEKLN